MQHPQVGVYFSLTDAEGKYGFEIRLVYLDQDQLVGKGSLPPIDIQNRLATHDFGVNIPYLVFPGPGRYEFRLFADGNFITQKDFQVIQQDTPPQSPSWLMVANFPILFKNLILQQNPKTASKYTQYLTIRI